MAIRSTHRSSSSQRFLSTWASLAMTCLAWLALRSLRAATDWWMAVDDHLAHVQDVVFQFLDAIMKAFSWHHFCDSLQLNLSERSP